MSYDSGTDASERTGRTNGVSRRKFVRALGAGGITAGLAGCSGGGGDGGGGTTVGEPDTDGGTTTVQIVAESVLVNSADKVSKALHDAGLSEDIQIEFLSGGQVTDDLQAKFRQWLSAGRKTPDIFKMDSGWTIPFIVRDQLLNLEEALSDSVLDEVHNNYFQKSVNTATDGEGNLYAVPLYPDFPTIQYRKDLAQEAGYDLEQYTTDPISWKEFSQIVADIYEQSDLKYGFNWQGTASIQLSCCVFNEYLTSFGGAYFGNPEKYLFGPVGDRPVTVDEQPVIDSLKMGRTFMYGSDAPHTLDDYAGKISPEALVGWDVEPSRKPFTNGNAVALRNWPYSIRITGAEDALGTDQGVMPMPYGVESGEGKYPGTGGSIHALGGWHFAVNPNSEKKDAAMEVLKATTKKSWQIDMFKITGFMPPKPSVLKSSAAKEVPIMGRYVDTLAFAGQNSMPRPITRVWPQEGNKVAQQANAALKDTPPSKAMSELKSQLEAIEQSA